MDGAYELRRAILHELGTGARKPGQRLPTERELSDRYRISRTSVRRVLGELKAQGLITQTVGSGTYVAERVGAPPTGVGAGGPARSTSPGELMEARLAIEPAVVEMVVANASAADFDRMEECCRRAEAAASVEAFEHWDGMLHEAIAGAAHNAFVSSVFRLMNQVRSQGEWGMLKKRSLTPGRRQEYQREHRLLVAALKNRDLDRARQLTLAHLLHVRRNLFGS